MSGNIFYFSNGLAYFWRAKFKLFYLFYSKLFRCGSGVSTCDVSYATVTAKIAAASDPCPAVSKYLIINYDCVPSKAFVTLAA